MKKITLAVEVVARITFSSDVSFLRVAFLIWAFGFGLMYNWIMNLDSISYSKMESFNINHILGTINLYYSSVWSHVSLAQRKECVIT